MVARTAAAPDMSVFMVVMDVAGFNDRPPESKVIPLPTSTTCRASADARAPSDEGPPAEGAPAEGPL